MATKHRIAAGAAGGFDLHSHRADAPGPRLVVLGGVHGDETEGVLAAGRLATADLALIGGQVDVVPVCHEAAFAIDSRISPIDDKNLARVFPGDPAGSATEQLAHHLYREVLAGADLLIDLHTSGQSYDMPFLAGYHGPTRGALSLARTAAEHFGADFIWRHPALSTGRTVSVVEQAIYVESLGGGATNADVVARYVQGVKNVMVALGLLNEAGVPGDPNAVRVVGGGNLDRDMISVESEGVLMSAVDAGARVIKAQLLGRVEDIHGTVLEELRAPADGWVMARKRRSPVAADDLVFCLASDDG